MLPAIAGSKFKEGENFNHPDEIGTGIHTLSILRIALKLHFVQNVEPDIPQVAGGKRGRFAKVSLLNWSEFMSYRQSFVNVLY